MNNMTEDRLLRRAASRATQVPFFSPETWRHFAFVRIWKTET